MMEKITRLLRQTERYTRTDMIYLAKGGFWQSFGFGAQILGGVIVTIALANTVAKGDLGTYQFIISTATILGAFTLTGIALSITTATARGDEGALRSGTRIKLKWNIGVAIASFVVAAYYFYNQNDTLGTAFLIVGAFSPFIEGFQLYQPYLIGKEQFRLNAFLNVLRKLLPMMAILTTLVFTRDPLHLVFTYFASHAITMFILYKITTHHFQLPFSDTFSSNLRFSKHLSVMQFLSRVAKEVDKILIFYHLGAIAVATFTIAQLPSKYTGSTLGILNGLVLPKLSRRDFPTLQQTLPRKVHLLFILAALITAAYIFCAPLLFALVFPTYPEAVLISQVLALSILMLPRSTYQQALTAHQKTNSLYAIQIGLPILKLILLYVLLPLYGLWGAVYAILATDTVGAILSYVFFKKVT